MEPGGPVYIAKEDVESIINASSFVHKQINEVIKEGIY